jgi:two-component system response regulator
MQQRVAILLVDNDPADCALTLRALHSVCDPARIACATSAADALDWLLGRGAHAGRDARRQPRLVLLEADLPDAGGLQLLNRMREDPLTQPVPVVVLTRSSDKAELDRCYRAGANSVVRKSADPEELGRKIRQLYEFWMHVNEANRNSRV